jgi:putative nucleotidyltransferase with HDIG domain
MFVALTALVALVTLTFLPVGPAYALSVADIFGLSCFVAVGVLSELMAIDFRLGQGRQAKSSLAFLPFLASIVLFEPIISVATVGLVISISQFVLRRNDFARGIFNIAQGIVSAAWASLVYIPFLGALGRVDISFVGFTFLAAVFFTTNIALSSFAISLIKQQRFSTVLAQVAGVRGGNLWYDLLASPIAIVPAALYEEYNVIGLLIIVLPLLLIRYSYLSKIQLEEANRDLLKVLVKAIETRDPYTSGHSVRVATLARRIAEDLGLPPRRIQLIETAALLHDIGKIDSAYAELIRKPYDLDYDERELIRTHATRGADLLESLTSVSSEVILAVRHHHERYDGTGYPSGLQGEAIPVAARIIMLCDSVDAMLSDRPYRPALSIEKTRMELVRCSGTQFDPSIVQVVLQKNTLERAKETVAEQHEKSEDRRPRLTHRAIAAKPRPA